MLSVLGLYFFLFFIMLFPVPAIDDVLEVRPAESLFRPWGAIETRDRQYNVIVPSK